MPSINSSPATFSGPVQTVTFAVPSGTWIAASWQTIGVANEFFHTGSAVQVATVSGAHALIMGAVLVGTPPGTPFNFMQATTMAQLGDINAEAGGTLSVEATGANLSFSSFVLSLTGSSSVGSIIQAAVEASLCPPFYSPNFGIQNS